MEAVQAKVFYGIGAVLIGGGVGHWLTITILRWLKVMPSGTPARNAYNSKWIGIAERCAVILLVMGGAIGSTVFIFATKTAVMAHRLDVEGADDKRRLTEYMLIGTLVSYVVGLMFGLLGKAMLQEALR